VTTPGEIRAGWIAGHNVRTLFVEQPELLTAFSFAVVTCLDSTRDVGPYLRAQVPGAVSLGDGVVLAVAELETLLHEAGAFVGFDEVSLFDERPAIPKPDDVWFTSDEPITDRVDIDSLRAWVSASGCGLAVGDGIGLNYITVDFAIARSLDALRTSSA
jgi:hypothetical protein